MLLTDSGIIVIADLERYEAEIKKTAAAQGVDLETKISVAVEDCQSDTQAHAQLSSNIFWNPNRIIGKYLYGDFSNTRLRNEQIVVTTALKRWLVFHCLAVFYRDCWRRKNGDRYEPQMQEYGDRARDAWDAVRVVGFGYVTNPLPQPGKPALSTVSGGALAARAYEVRVAWQNAQGKFSGASLNQAIAVDASKLLLVNISGLTPPQGENVGGGDTPFQRGTATAWVVYVNGTAQSTVALSSTTWTEPVGGLIAGASLTDGQEPDAKRNLSNVVMRG